MAKVDFREEVLNVALAELLEQRGMLSVPETIRKAIARKTRDLPDILVGEAVLNALDELESIFRSSKPRFDLLQPLIKALVDNSQKILKANWERVREGEEGYRKAKSRAVIVFWVFTVIGVLVAIFYGLRWLKVICP